MIHLSQAQPCLTKATAELNNIKQRVDKVNKALELDKAVDVEWDGLHTRVHASTMEIALSWSRGGFTEWLKILQVLHLRSGIQ